MRHWVRHRARAALLLALLLPARPATAQEQRVLLQVPLVKQPYMRCLVASVSMVLKYWGLDVPPDAIAERVPVYKDGTTGRDLVAYIETIGYRGFLIQPPFADLYGHLGKGRPVIITIPEGSSRHAMVLVGFDPSTRIVWLNDPADGVLKSQPEDSFRKQWEAGQRWALLILPK